MRAVLLDPEGEQVELRTFEQYRDGGSCRVQAAFPRPGDWTVDLYCGTPNGVVRNAASFEVEVEAKTGSSRRFPVTSLGYARARAYLHQPLQTPLPRGSRQTFRITVPRAPSVYLVQGDRARPLQRVSGEADTFELEAVVEEDPKLVVGRLVLVEFPAE